MENTHLFQHIATDTILLKNPLTHGYVTVVLNHPIQLNMNYMYLIIHITPNLGICSVVKIQNMDIQIHSTI